MSRTIKTYRKNFNNNPIVLNELIEEFIGFETTRFCKDCEEITSLGDWLVKKIRNEKGIIVGEDLKCSNCYSVCCNSRCDDTVQHKDTLRNVECNCGGFEDGLPLCETCYDDESFYCDGCSENLHNNCFGDDCVGCSDCSNKFCDNCRCDGNIFTCDVEDGCYESSCCRRFLYMSHHQELTCEHCVNERWIRPG